MLDKKLFKKIFTIDEIYSAEYNKNYVECTFADGKKSILPVIKIEKLLLYSDKKMNTILNVMAVCGSDFNNYDIILHNSFKTEV